MQGQRRGDKKYTQIQLHIQIEIQQASDQYAGVAQGGREEGYQETRTSYTSYPFVQQRSEDLWEF